MASDDSKVSDLRSLVASHLTPYYDTHFNLLRWIQAFPGVSLDKIAKRLRHHLMFRASSWDVDSIHDRERGHDPILEYWPITIAGTAKNNPNCLLLFEQSGFIDYEGIHDNFSITDIVKAKLSDAEHVLSEVMRMEQETGERPLIDHPCEQSTVMLVIDVDGVGYSKKLIDLMMGPMNSRSEFMLQHYVELVDCEQYFHVNILSSSNWREEILTIMDPASCPALWNDDTHHEFQLQMERPPRVPRLEITIPLEALEKLHVKAGRVGWLEFDLQKGDTLSFHITGDSSFGFAIVRVENEDDDDVFAMPAAFPLFPWIHGPLKIPLEDTVVAPTAGLYKAWFSNSRAWWSSFTIRYNFKIVKSQSNN